jgi:hypothetical protein
MTPTLVLLILFAGISVYGIVPSALLLRRVRKLTRMLARHQTEKEVGEFSEATGGFSPVLRHVDLQARLQQGRQRREMPEKYRFIRSLAERGVPAVEIAGILNLPSDEVDQLLALAKVARRQSPMAAKASRPKKVRTLIQPKDFSPPAEKVNSDC